MFDSLQRNHSVIRFGLFEAHPLAGELRKKGVRVKVQDQPFQVLLALLENPNEVVTRNELRNRLWPSDTYVDFDQGLNRAVAKLRDVLGDPAEKPVYIQTITRRGYRFLAPVERLEAPPGSAKRARRGATSWWRWAAVALSIALLTGFAFRRKVSLPRSQEPIRSLAVLPLENLSADPSQEYFADGMTDALITQLARINGLSVISRTSVMNYKGKHVPLPQIARTLDVDAVIEGTVMRSGDRVRITVQLIRTSTDRHLWAQSYEEQLQNVISLQDSIARDVAEQIHAELAPTPSARPNPSSDAYEAYLRGRSYLITGLDTPQAIRRAQNYFEQSIHEDPNFAPAYSGLADCYVLLTEFRWLSPRETYPSTREAIRKALELDETLADAHTALAWVSWRQEWNWNSAEREYKYALQLNPNDVDGHQGLAWYLAWSGRTAEARTEIAKIRQLDPNQDWAIDEAGIYYHQRSYTSLVDAGRQSVSERPDYWISHYFLAVGYQGSGRLKDAIAEYRKALEISPGETDATAGLASAYAAAGKRSEAREILNELQEQSKRSYVSPYMMATIYAALGEKQKAFQLLQQAYKEKSTDLPYFLRVDLRMDPLRSDPRFRKLLQQMAFPSSPPREAPPR